MIAEFTTVTGITAVPGALAVQLEQFRCQRAAGSMSAGRCAQRTHGSAASHRSRSRSRHAGTAQRFDADQRILPPPMATSACGADQRRRLHGASPAPATGSQPRRFSRCGRRIRPAIEVNGLHQCGGIGIDAVTVDADRIRYAGLVVADAGDQFSSMQRRTAAARASSSTNGAPGTVMVSTISGPSSKA